MPAKVAAPVDVFKVYRLLLPVAAAYSVPVLLNVRAFKLAGKPPPIRVAAPVTVLMLYKLEKEIP